MSALNIRHCRLIELPRLGDERRGYLSFGEAGRTIPFEIRRVYYTYAVGDAAAVRGQHAHRKLEQAFFCLHGKVTFRLDDGAQKAQVELNEPHRGLYIGPRLWHDLVDFDGDTVLLALASDYYDEKDYIRDYDEFLEYIKENN